MIFAAETAEMGKIKSEAHAALNELRQKGPAYKRKIAWWGRAGEGAISLGCIAAAVSGQVRVRPALRRSAAPLIPQPCAIVAAR